MEENILIITSKRSNILNAIEYYLNNEKLKYLISNFIEKIDKNITTIIYIDDNEKDLNNLIVTENIRIIYISDKKKIIELPTSNTNYIITKLLTDTIEYTSVQQEYLFKKGIYNTLLKIIDELLVNKNNYNNIIYDITEIKTTLYDWTFKFESITETYAWLSKMNKNLPKKFIRKGINFYNDKVVYNDSSKEINYLTEKIIDIKDSKSIDLFICTKEEFNLLKNNFFFKLLLKNISSTYNIYLIDKGIFQYKEKELMKKVLDGIIIYEDCVYIDTYEDEFSLGYVDCNKESLEEYNKAFTYIMNNYGYKINSEDDFNEFLK